MSVKAPANAANKYAEKRRQPRSPLWRIRVWQLFLILGMVAIAGRLYYLQIMRGAELTRKAEIQREQNNLLIHRGAITDRHGLPLAIDTTRYNVFVHSELLTVSRQEAARTFARLCHIDEKEAERRLNITTPAVTMAQHLSREEVEEIQRLNWPGVDIVPRSFRHYPEGKLASHILGYVNTDTRGQGGVEQAVENSLQSTGGLNRPQLDGHGREIIGADTTPTLEITPPMGRNVELTIDNYLQHLAEKEVTAMCMHSQALKGCAIILDPQNGEVLAWANYPSYDPNEYDKYKYETTKNWAMVDVYQPGSTFKVLTVSSALDLGVIKPNSTFIDNGTLCVGNRILHNHEKGGHGALDILHLFIYSSNVAAAQVGLLMTPQQFWTKLSDFGIGKKTGIELSGESAGLLTNYKDWKPIDQATTGFGQGAVAVTPLQMISAVSAVANGGIRMQPHLIRRIYDPKTGVTEKWTEPVRTRVLQPEVAHLIASLLAQNIEKGTQIAGKVPGYRVGGKTGTANKVTANGRGYIAGATIASFVGFLPPENPQIACMVVVDTPRTEGGWGNTVAGPVFNAICVEAARYLGIPPSARIEMDSKKDGPNSSVPPSVKYEAELQSRSASDNKR
jgi:cell division protein FtsI/penicillin-binding protein 2